MNEETKNLVCLLLTDTDPDIRRRAAEDLAECDDRNVLAVLSIALQDKNKGVEDAVSRSFLSIGGVAAARAIVYHIEDENIASRNLAAKLLIKMGKNSVHAIVPYLRSDNKDVRKLAVDILGEIKSKEPIYYLLPLLKDTDPNVIVAAVEALRVILAIVLPSNLSVILMSNIHLLISWRSKPLGKLAVTLFVLFSKINSKKHSLQVM